MRKIGTDLEKLKNHQGLSLLSQPKLIIDFVTHESVVFLLHHLQSRCAIQSKQITFHNP